MNKFVTINDKKIEIPSRSFTAGNASALLFAGHVFHSCEKHKLSVTEEDRNVIIEQLDAAEGWLFPAINGMGEMISALDKDQLEDTSLNNTGYLISTLTELLQSVQQARRLVSVCLPEGQEVH